MAKGYWIARVDVNDLDGYKAYVAANAEPIFEKYGGHIRRCAAASSSRSRASCARASW